MKLSTRLLHCANYTQGFNKLADIGTDHAFLPIYAIQEGFVSTALAVDNKEGPYVVAYSNVKKHGLEEKIKVILADGLTKLDDDVDVVVISGMGGGLISNILQASSLRNVKRFILQPNNNSQAIRKALSEIKFKIIDEIMFLDGEEIYEIMVIEKGEESYTNLELLFGPILLRDKPYYFELRCKHELEKYQKILAQVSEPHDRIRIQAQIKLIEEALS